MSLTVGLGDVGLLLLLGDVGAGGDGRCHQWWGWGTWGCCHRVTLVLGDMGDVVDGEAAGHGGMLLLLLGNAGAGAHGGHHQQWGHRCRVVMDMAVVCLCWGAYWWLMQWWKWWGT